VFIGLLLLKQWQEIIHEATSRALVRNENPIRDEVTRRSLVNRQI
jgi:hypothetical protein